MNYTLRVTDTATGVVRFYDNPSGRLASVADTAAFPGGGSAVQSGSAAADSSATAGNPMNESDLRTIQESRAAAPGGFGGSSIWRSRIVSGAASVPCVAGSTALCLNSSRFKVEVNWSVPSQGTSGVGMAVPITGDTGYFWFFSSNNIELVIKVVDGRGFNNKFWVFYGALSNVQYRITVTDTQTGAVKTYVNPSGNLASVADTAAF